MFQEGQSGDSEKLVFGITRAEFEAGLQVEEDRMRDTEMRAITGWLKYLTVDELKQVHGMSEGFARNNIKKMHNG